MYQLNFASWERVRNCKFELQVHQLTYREKDVCLGLCTARKDEGWKLRWNNVRVATWGLGTFVSINLMYIIV